MIKVKLYFRCLKNENEGIIHVQFHVERKKVHFSTKVRVLKKDWSEKTMKVRSTDKNHSDKNLILNNILARINNVDVKFRLRDRKLTRELFLKYYNRPDDYDTFHVFCEDYLKKTFRRLNINTIRLHESVLRKLKNHNPDLHFDQINRDWLEDYVVHLKKDMHNNDNTAHKNIGVIRKYVLAAIREGYMETNPFEDFSVKQSRPNIVFLEEEELAVLWRMYRDEDIEDKYYPTLRFFLFLCFGSQHVGDAMDMRIEQFSNVSFTYYRKKLMNSKPEPVTVPIATALRIIVTEIMEDRTTGKIFIDLPAEQTMNYYLKEIAEQACIDKKITLKTGRHTFATIFLENNPNPKVLQTILGHSDIKQTMNYVHALERTKQRGISCFDKLLE